MKIYTRTGDAGSTGLFGGPRVAKDDRRIEAYGTVDELNAALGIARACGVAEVVDDQLDQIQHELFSIGAELATPDPDAHQLRVINQQHVEQLELWIDAHESGLEPLKHFILPGGSIAASHLHLARAICRRAERRVVTLGSEPPTDAGEGPISESLIVYLNRLSDYLFVLSRAVNQNAGISEVKWVR
ncbi:MAG: cob(I)yrinic acid a,c-diamide adenosyltransferase, partial [Pirellulaceae bacterium]|nr:cob(I)yrinic acid a,c-diamide adenosyltransferase [Pirellulaceae bacterium]